MLSVDLLNERKYSAVLDDLNRFQEVHIQHTALASGLATELALPVLSSHCSMQAVSCAATSDTIMSGCA